MELQLGVVVTFFDEADQFLNQAVAQKRFSTGKLEQETAAAAAGKPDGSHRRLFVHIFCRDGSGVTIPAGEVAASR